MTGVCMCNMRVCVCVFVCVCYCCLLQWYLMCTYDCEPQDRFPYENVVRTITDSDSEKQDKLHKWAVLNTVFITGCCWIFVVVVVVFFSQTEHN